MINELLPKVIVPNELLNSSYEYTSHEIDLLCRVYSEIRRNTGSVFQFDLLELSQLMGDSGRKYEYLRTAIKNLLSKPMEYWHEDLKITIIASPISSAKIIGKRGQVIIEVQADLAKWIKETSSQYTEFDLNAIMKLRGKYSKRIYMNCRQFLSTGMWYINFEKLRQQLKIEGYDRLEDFKKRVIYPALDEINLLSDVKIEFSTIRSGRKVDTLCFSIVLKEQAVAVCVDKNQEKIMLEAGLSRWQVNNVFFTLSRNEIARALYDFNIRKAEIRNKAPYLVKTFEGRGVPMKAAIPNQLKIA
jgi:plasmid replication initiation protein